MASTASLDLAFEALANSKRRAMLYGLAFRPATISQLAKEQALSLPAMHKHMRVLERADLIARRKAGRTNFVAINRASMQAAQDWIMQFNTAWGSDQESLANYIASLERRT